MKTHDFYYDLPPELIAQTPLERRDSSRLMTLDRQTGELSHRHFYDIIDYLNPGDALVINETRVIPARLIGERPSGGACEILLRRLPENRPCGIARNIGREGESREILTLGQLRWAQVDMFCTVFIGNASTKVIGGELVTPRGYRHG